MMTPLGALHLQVLTESAANQATAAAKSVSRHKQVQADHAREYEDALVTLKAKVKDMEGQEMRETIQDKVCSAELRQYHNNCSPISGICCQATHRLLESQV